MLKADQIPDEVYYAFQKAWEDQSTLFTNECIAAAINAWPGMEIETAFMAERYLILPVPQEPRDG